MQSKASLDAAAPSTGPLTFMLTDIQGSTRLWEAHPDEMASSMVRHDELVAWHVAIHDGELVGSRGEGDSAFVVFRDAGAALACACDLQLALTAESWPPATLIRVRIALHTGVVQPRAGGHYGSVVNRCARIRAVTHGAQVLLSEATVESAGVPPEGATFRDLGLHRLRDLSVPERIFQLCHPGLGASFPSLQTLDSATHNLPVQLTSFVGRQREIAEVRELMGAARLLTLTGSGGCGKTRLALEVAAGLLDSYTHGVWMVDLAALSDPTLVPAAALLALGLREEPGRPLVEILKEHLRGRRILIVLDNCEHLLEGCAELAVQLLTACPELRIVATSRQSLGVRGETTFRIPSMTVPDDSERASVDQMASCEAVRLFVDRARAADPDFRLTPADAGSVSQICRLLEGIPLAIELAAARVSLLAPSQIARRLGDRRSFLVAGSRTALPRHQTLRATMDWSHELLADEERVLLRRLSVFAGGWSLDAAEAVCGRSAISADSVLDLLNELVSKSLVLTERRADETRYRMLETIRQYALDKLAEAGEGDWIRTRHRECFLTLAERAEQELFRATRVGWNHLTAELDNLRAALEWSVNDAGGGEAAVRLSGALGEFWDMRGDYREGGQWLALALDRGADARPANRARALIAAGLLASRESAYAAARSFYEQGLALALQAGADQVTTLVLGNLGLLSFWQGEVDDARALMAESLELARRLADPWLIARAISLRVHLESSLNPAGIEPLAEESLSIARTVGDQFLVSRCLYFLGLSAQFHGDYERARTLFEDTLTIAREVGARWEMTWALTQLGWLEISVGRYPAAKPLLEESLKVQRQVGNRLAVPSTLTGLGMVELFTSGNYTAGKALVEEGLSLGRELGTDMWVAWCLYALGEFAHFEGDLERSWEFHRQALERHGRIQDVWGIPVALEALAGVALGQRQFERAAWLYGAAESLRDRHRYPRFPSLRDRYELSVDEVRAAMHPDDLRRHWEAGRSATMEQVLTATP
jgi:predicted ATPase/class 3 adenylate cyclase